MYRIFMVRLLIHYYHRSQLDSWMVVSPPCGPPWFGISPAGRGVSYSAEIEGPPSR
jgi:hypothetical protein